MNKLFPFLAFSILLLVPVGTQNAFSEPDNTHVILDVFQNGFSELTINDPDGIASIVRVDFDTTFQGCSTNVSPFGVLVPREIIVTDCQNPPDVTTWLITSRDVTCVSGSCLLDNPTIIVNTDKSCYVKLDTVTVFGSVSEVIPDDLVILTFVSSIGNLVAISQLEAAPDGSYTVSVLIDGPLWSPEGTYIVKAEWILNTGPQASVILANAETAFLKLNSMCPQLVGGELIPIETTSLLLAGTQTFSWMIPVIVSAVGIGIVIARKL